MKAKEVVHYLKNPETRQELISTLQNVDENSETIQGLKEVLDSLTKTAAAAKNNKNNKEGNWIPRDGKIFSPSSSIAVNFGQTQRVNMPNPDIFHNFLISKMSDTNKFNFFVQFLRIFKKLNLVITPKIFENWMEIENLILASMHDLNFINISFSQGECVAASTTTTTTAGLLIPKDFDLFLTKLLSNSNNTLRCMKIPTFFLPCLFLPQLTLQKVTEICFQTPYFAPISSKNFGRDLECLSQKLKNLSIVSVENFPPNSKSCDHFFIQQPDSSSEIKSGREHYYYWLEKRL